ncbi:MAG: hypothetical protein Q8K67_12600 [Geothrix sp.]|nr:hypothetical protein [Geothrix sp.]
MQNLTMTARVFDHLAEHAPGCRAIFASSAFVCAPTPDPVREDAPRLRYRADIKAMVREVVLSGKSIPEAEEPIRAYAKAKLPKESWTRFLTVVETELTSLHDGNYARNQLRPSEFAAWHRRRP